LGLGDYFWCSGIAGESLRMDAGRGGLVGGIGVERVQAVADVVAEEGGVDAAEGGGVGFEFAEGGGEEAGGAERVRALEVVEGDSDLDEALQEGLFGLRGSEPEGFPGFVGGKEFSSIVVPEALGERAVGPVEGHVFGQKERTTEILSKELLRMTTRS